MNKKRFSLAEEGLNIIESYPNPRSSARELCRLLSDVLDAQMVRLEYRKNENYSWTEQVDRTGMPFTTGYWNLPLSDGMSRWQFNGGKGLTQKLSPVIELISRQWLYYKSHYNPCKHLIKTKNSPLHYYTGWITVSRASRTLFNQLSRIFLCTNPILLTGSAGSGKSYIAKLIHCNSYDPGSQFCIDENRDDRPGTVYISDWQMLTPKIKKLCLNGKKRVIAVILQENYNEDLHNDWMSITEGKGFTIKVPSLTERVEDIPLLASHFLQRAAISMGWEHVPAISLSVINLLATWHWPGNVRELRETMVKTLEQMSDSAKTLEVEDLPSHLRGGLPNEKKMNFQNRLDRIERDALILELQRNHGNQTKTAGTLGISVRQLQWRLKRYNIDPAIYKINRKFE